MKRTIAIILLSALTFALLGGLIVNSRGRIITVQQNFLNQKPYVYTVYYWRWFEVKEFDCQLWREVEDIARITGMRLQDKDYYFNEKIIFRGVTE